jgi:hypothetical protein
MRISIVVVIMSNFEQPRVVISLVGIAQGLCSMIIVTLEEDMILSQHGDAIIRKMSIAKGIHIGITNSIHHV